ncbi:MAG TPA: hypothetical protein VHY18_14880 [Solirubrobacteraceae bacterium]|jgi:hypothetical protein|nr:hypothetical protein [Solirubrobacteraceae bacterium]
MIAHDVIADATDALGVSAPTEASENGAEALAGAAAQHARAE